MVMEEMETVRLAEEMRRGVSIKDRMYHLQLYKSCFVGEQAVHWLVEQGHAADAEEAVEIGNRMLLMGLLHHVCHEHLFQNAYLFYRFNLDEEDGQMVDVMKMKKPKHKTLVKMKQNPSWSLAKEVARVQRSLNKVEKNTENGMESLAAALQQVGEDHTRVVDSLNALKQGLNGMNRSLISATSLLTILTVIVIFAFHNSRVPAFMVLLLCLFHLLEVYRYSKKLQRIHVPDYFNVYQQSARPIEPIPITRAPSLQETLLQHLPPLEEWRHHPLLLRVNKSLVNTEVLNKDMDRNNLPINWSTPIEFESPYFKGRIVVYIAGLENSPDSIFAGRRRQLQTVVQGRFKKEVSFNDVFTGQEWFRPLLNLPSIWFVNLVVSILSAVSPTMAASGITSDKPKLLAKLASSSQVICISPNEESAPDITAPFDEDMSAAGPPLCLEDGTPIKVGTRKKVLSSSSTLRKLSFNTRDVYTFSFWQHALDLSTMSLNTGVGKFELAKYLNSQPVAIMAKTRQNEYLWRFELWHESLVVQPTDAS